MSEVLTRQHLKPRGIDTSQAGLQEILSVQRRGSPPAACAQRRRDPSQADLVTLHDALGLEPLSEGVQKLAS